MSLITLVVKRTRKLLAGNPHEQFDVAGAGNGLSGAPRLPSTLPKDLVGNALLALSTGPAASTGGIAIGLRR